MAQKKNYTVVVDGWSEFFDDREEALNYANEVSLGNDVVSVKVYNSFHNCIWEG